MRKEVSELIKQGLSEKEAKKESAILKRLRICYKWERGDKEVIELWKTMNNWVYDGFDITYKNIGVDFDKNYRKRHIFTWKISGRNW